MSEDDLKLVLAKYQQKAFELFNQNIVFETQIEQLNNTISQLRKEVQTLSTKAKRSAKSEDFT